jgi:DNA invertase Pin-like site-specific DNA recombinase
MTAYGYARVSTRTQERDGNSLASQREALLEAGCDEVVCEAFTGTTTDRPLLDALLGRLEDGDSLVVTRLDRIARSTVEGCSLVRDLVSRGVTVRVLNMGVLDSSPVGKMLVSVMFAMAEFERDMIVQRTAEGREVARQRPGYREGRPPAEVERDVLLAHAAAVRERSETVADACRACGVGRTTWYRLLREAAA